MSDDPAATWFCITAPHLTAAIRFDEDGIADYAAPVLYWMVKRRVSTSWARNYCRRANWVMEKLP